MIGFASTIFLARLLEPADFGIIAMATLVVGLIEVFLAFGIDAAVLQRQDSSPAYLNTAWTIRLTQGVLIAAAAAACAPLAGLYFKDSRVTSVLLVLSSSIAVSAAGNVGIVLLRKEFNFRREFLYTTACKVFTFVVTLSAAFYLRTYWSLVIGMTAGAIFGTLASYVAHPYRPRLSRTHWKEIWSFSQWNLVSSIAVYFESRLDALIVGRIGSAQNLGVYSVASETGQLPTAEISGPLSRVLYPVYAQLQGEPDRLRAAYLNAMATLNALILPAGIGLALVAQDAVPVLLGEKWSSAVPLLEVFALYGVLRSVGGSAGVLLTAIGKVRIAAAISVGSLVAFLLGGTVVAGFGLGILAIAWTRLIASFANLVVVVYVISRYAGITSRSFFGVLFRPVVSCSVMAVCVLALPGHMESPMISLGLKCTVGAVAYGISTAVLWYIVGCPAGPEVTALQAARRFVGRTGVHGS